MIQKLNNIVIKGSCHKPILIDVTLKTNLKRKSVVVFCHGFKGFKDWGPFNQIADYFAEKDFVFLKFNFSYNGTTIKNPIEFDDLEAFGQNNFCKELDDLSLVLEWIKSSDVLKEEIDISKITLFGHSRGGGIAMLKSAEDNSVSKIISWASPSDFLISLPKGKKLQKWKDNDVLFIYNGRTTQNMPLYFQFYENCITNSKRLNIKDSVNRMRIPHLVVHGSDDPTVLVTEAEKIKKWNSNTKLHIISGANHVFGGFHPYNIDSFPKHLQQAIDYTIAFLKE